MAAPCEAIERHTSTIDQACGVELDAVLAARRRIATASGRLEDLVPLGAVLADLERFAEADPKLDRDRRTLGRQILQTSGIRTVPGTRRRATGGADNRPRCDNLNRRHRHRCRSLLRVIWRI
jgi:hypothetical protein